MEGNLSVSYKMKEIINNIAFDDRSVHGFADTDLSTLINDLKKEEDDLCAHRGLVPGTTDQTFILSLTHSFKSLYDEFMKQKNNVRMRLFVEKKSITVNNTSFIFMSIKEKILNYYIIILF